MNNEQLLDPVFRKILKYIKQDVAGTAPVVDFKMPGELSKLIDFPVSDAGVSQSEFLQLLENYLNYSVKTGNKQFLNQLYSGFNLPAFIGEVFTALSNTSMYTYEVAPVATMIEKEMINLMNSYVGYANGDGTFLTGGSNGNLVAMFSARNRIDPQSRFSGNSRSRVLIGFINEHAHYSLDTAANLIGIGSNALIRIKSDRMGRMIPAELDKAMAASLTRGETPFFVAATCATTIHGSYDPIDEIVSVARKYNAWIHADGSFGGSIILCDEHRYLMKGIELTDSFIWNPHKLMNIPLICSALLVREKGTLQHNITDINTDYIYHDSDGVEDLGKKSIQCGRHVDAVKLWFSWKYFGKEGYIKRIDNLIDIAKYAEEVVKNEQRLELQFPRQSFTVCFRYIPAIPTDLNVFNLKLREELRKSGNALVNYSHLGKDLTIRLVITNGEMERKDIDHFFESLLRVAASLERNIPVRTVALD